MRDNVIANATFWDVAGVEKKTPGKWLGYFPPSYESPINGAGTNVGNALTGNCSAHPTVTTWASPSSDSSHPLRLRGDGCASKGTDPVNGTDNKWSTAAVSFVDPDTGDYTMNQVSGCVGYGPDAIQPAVVPPPPADRMFIELVVAKVAGVLST